MKSALHLTSLAVLLCLFTSPLEAAKPPFKAPPGAQVSYASSGKDYAVWTIFSKDYSASAVVGQIKLPRQYWKSDAFRRYVNNFYKSDQTLAGYGINIKTTWKNGAYTLSGVSGGYRVYGKGRLSKNGTWLYGSAVGPQKSNTTAAFEKMIKGL